MCKILTAYEGPETQGAISNLEQLIKSLPGIPDREETVNSAIDFSLFWRPNAWGEAVAAAPTADVIVVSLSGKSDLPMPVQRWMESWPRYGEIKHTTLVLLLKHRGDNQDRLLSFFQKIAQQHGLDFICNCTESAELLGQSVNFQRN